MDILAWIEKWYKRQCDGSWEHLYGVRIDNIDNPGWSVKIDLYGTELEDKEFEEIQYIHSDEDWLFCQIEDNCFIGSGDPNKLKRILEIFKKWVQE